MSDDPYADEEAPPHPADPPQQLVDFVGAFTDPAAQQVFGDAAVRIQDYMVRRDLADQNAAAADRTVNNIDQFKSGLVNMVRSDPAATMLGLDLVPDVIGGLVGSHPFLPDDQRQDTHDQLTSDIQQEVARSGVMALADRNEEAARRLLDHPRVSDVLDDQARGALNGYISAQATARDIDSAALAQQRQVDAERTRDHSMLQYFNTLVAPDGSVEFPQGWAQKVLSDPTLPPGTTAVMLDSYNRLRANGDVDQSDPFMIQTLVRTAAAGGASVPGILEHAGSTLALEDATTLAALATPAGKAEAQKMSAIIDTAQRVIAAPENGPAGVSAFNRFVNWLVPEFRGGGSLDPRADNYIIPSGDSRVAAMFWDHFSPKGDDMIPGMAVPGQFRNMDPSQDRMSLDQIFGAPRRQVTGDQVIRAPRSFDMGRATRGMTEEDLNVGMGNNSTAPDLGDGEPRYHVPEIKS